MAAAVPLTAAVRPTRVSLVGTGGFGARVNGLLAGRSELRAVEADDLATAFSQAADAVVLALWRPSRDLCERADTLSFRYQRPWLPIIMEHPIVRIGPTVLPPHGPCFDCYRQRRVQHDTQPAVTSALEAAYDADPFLGPQGHLPHHARASAAIAHDLLDDLPSPSDRHPAGTVVTFALHKNTVALSPVLACHGCARCGENSVPAPTEELCARLDQVRASAARCHEPTGRRY